MIQESEIASGSGRVLLQYFERAAEDLGLKAWFHFLAPGREQDFRSMAVSELSRFLSPEWIEKREAILRSPEDHFRWEPSESPIEEIKAHYIMQAAIFGTLMGDKKDLRTLAAQLVIGPMNWKLAISYFLGNLSDGRLGLTYKELPTKAQILQWVRAIGQVELTDKLDEIVELKDQ